MIKGVKNNCPNQIFYIFEQKTMNWLLHPIRDFLIWMFENTLEPLGNSPNIIFFFIIFGGLVYWMFVQNKLNKKADQDPNQIK